MAATPHPQWYKRAIFRVGRGIRTSLATVGAATTVAGLTYLYQEKYGETGFTLSPDNGKPGKPKPKKVLVIPFERLELVEQKQASQRELLSQLLRRGDDDNSTLKMSVRDVVDAIHEAAADPEIVALYGTFGGMPAGGWADLEEVRNALRVFRESHRRHPEPNLNHDVQVIPCAKSKPLYCYAPSMLEPTNKEYYVASMFTHIHLQNKGELALFGPVSTQFFLKDFLRKYGILMHVFKHGDYKNAPNMFTESSFTRAHKENVTNLLEALNDQQCDDITAARSQALLTSWMREHKPKKNNKGVHDDLWKQIQESGIFPAQTAWKTGLVDYMPHKDPLRDLLAVNAPSNDQDADAMNAKVRQKEELMAKWDKHETDFERFQAEKAVTLQAYSKKIKSRQRKERRQRSVDKFTQKLPFLQEIWGQTDSKKSEKVALLYANGGITESDKLVRAIRQIKDDKDVKCVVLRVNSPGGSVVACESIRQELAGLPLVVSFGNVAASGGYYVSTHADRIFAQHKTVTGSIGVFALRPDLTKLAKQYKINVQHVAMSDLAPTFSPFHPMSKKMAKQLTGYTDRTYAQFKDLVSEGRRIPVENVETLAQGRVWTGEQAKANGLVDELGGLSRALAYARRTFCNEKDADVQVEEWPRSKSLVDRILFSNDGGAQGWFERAQEWGLSGNGSNVVKPSIEGLVQGLSRNQGSHLFLTVDENEAIRCLFQEHGDTFPSHFWD